MRKEIWSCRSCAALLLGAVAPARSSATPPKQREIVHRVEKVLVTTQLLGRRDDTSSSCPLNYSLCPPSLSGNCCPDGYGCATDSCFATTAGTASACGRQGYFACGIDVGGGCCPEGYVCGRSDCTAPVGVSVSQSCPVGYYLCPSSVNYGCCINGMGCALNACYATTPMTFVFTETFTTTSDSHTLTSTLTSTVVTTQSAPTDLPTSSSAAAIAKFIPTSQPKASAIVSTSPPSSSSSSGLTSAQLGGIIGGAVALLVIVLAATFIILRKLRKTQEAVQSRKASSSGDPTSRGAKPTMTQLHRPTASQVDQMEYDDLLQAPSDTTPAGETPSARARSASEFSSANPTPLDPRHVSVDSSHGGYFDVPTRVQNVPGRHSMSTDARTSVDSQPAAWQQFHYQRHGRNPSASELSDGSSEGMAAGVGTFLLPAELGVEGSVVPELPTTPFEGPRRRSSGFATPTSPLSRPPATSQHWRRSDGHVRERSASSAGQPQLGVVNEAAAEHLHGHYGPLHEVAGQTRAGLPGGYDANGPSTPDVQGEGPA